MDTKITTLTLDDFLSAFFPDPNETINLRTFKPKGAPDCFSEKIHTTRNQLLTDVALRQRLQRLNERNGIYFVVNSGGDTDSEITRYNAFFADFDDGSLDEQKVALDAAPIVPSIRTLAKRGCHAYWLIEGDCGEAEWRDIQNRIIDYFDSDRSIKNPSRVMRLPFFNHVTYNEGGMFSYKQVEVVEFSPIRRYTIAEMNDALPLPEFKQEPHTTNTVAYSTGDDPNADLKEWIVRNGIRNRRGMYEMKCPAHNGNSDTSFFYNPFTGAIACLKEPPCATAEIRRVAGLPVRPQSATRSASFTVAAADDGWVLASDVQAEEVEWLWHPYVALGKLTLFDGDPGCGKSFLTCAMAAAVSKGRKLEGAKPLSSESIEPRKVLVISGEDGLADTIIPRLDALGADNDKIILREKALTLDKEGLYQLEEIISRENPALVIIDPLFAFVGGIDIYRDNEARSVTTPLGEMAQRYGCAMVAIRHLTKQQQKAIYSGGGSIGFIGAARSALLFGRNPSNTDEGVIVHIKSNLSEKGASIGYKIAEDENGRVRFGWLGGRDVTAEQILANTSPTAKAMTERQRVRATITQEMSKEEIRKANPNVKERTLERYLSADVKDGFIHQPKKGYYEPLHYTEHSEESAAATMGVGDVTEVAGGTRIEAAREIGFSQPASISVNAAARKRAARELEDYELQERIAVMEYEGGMTREGAEYRARMKRPEELKTMQQFKGRITPKPQPLADAVFPPYPEPVADVVSDDLPF